MKKFVLFIIAGLLSLSISFNAYAQQKAIVEGDKVSLGYGEEAIVSVNIDNNSGVMGFKIMLDYDSDLLSVKNVSAGVITKEGNFVHNAGLKDGHVDIIWNGTSNVSGAGTLFSLNVKAIGDIKDNAEIKISYSQSDTFNEEYKNVVLDCKNIVVTANPKSSNSVVDESDVKTILEDNVSPEVIKNTVENVLSEIGVSSIDELNNEQKKLFVQAIEKNLKENFEATPNISEKIDTDSAIEIIKNVYDRSELTNNENSKQIIDSQEQNNSDKNNDVLIAVVALLGVLTIVGILFFVIRQKKYKCVASEGK